MGKRLTEAQKWALNAIANGYGRSPAALGERMMDRPGSSEHRNGYPYKSQGYGRMGGAMMARLEKMGLVRTWTYTGSPSNWHATKAAITLAGRSALEQEGDR